MDHDDLRHGAIRLWNDLVKQGWHKQSHKMETMESASVSTAASHMLKAWELLEQLPERYKTVLQSRPVESDMLSLGIEGSQSYIGPSGPHRPAHKIIVRASDVPPEKWFDFLRDAEMPAEGMVYAPNALIVVSSEIAERYGIKADL